MAREAIGRSVQAFKQRKKDAPLDHRALDAVLVGHCGHGPSEREHRHQCSELSGTRAGARLPGVLRARAEFQFLLLRWQLLGV